MAKVTAVTGRIPAALLVAAAVVLGLAAGSCGDSDSKGPVDVTLATLANEEASYEGRQVRTEGVVRTFESPRHYWIEDAYPNRVALEPADVAAPLVGEEVEVVGRFTFDEETGRVITIEEITRRRRGAPLTP